MARTAFPSPPLFPASGYLQDGGSCRHRRHSYQTGAHFIKDGKMYRVKRCHQLSQAHKANIDYKIGKYLVPETVKFEWKESDYHD